MPPLGIIKIAAIVGWSILELTKELVKARRIEKELKLKEKDDENTK